VRLKQLAFFLVFVAASLAAQETVQTVPTLDNLVASTDSCTGKVSSDAKMRAIWTAAGWQEGVTVEPSKGTKFSTYKRNDVNLNYFTSSIMKSCGVWTEIPDDYDLDALVAAMTVKLNKAPKIEEPGKRYYFQYYRGLKILNLLVKTDERGRYVELSVVH
jgi:hypothetical protein